MKILLSFFVLLPIIILSQEKKLELLPSGLQFMPLKANHQEARVGILYYPKNGYLKVDIGNNIDLIKFRVDSDLELNMGIEFMAYALSTNYQGRRLQIDALDGFFGGNVSMSYKLENSSVKSRLRIIHNSAHFVDGHYDFINNHWKNNINPIPFTQDFGELTLSHFVTYNSLRLQYFGSVAYSTLVRPSLIKKYSFNAGFEISSGEILGEFLGKETNLFYANYNRYAGMPDYKISTNNVFGIKFGEWEGKGIILYFSYYFGNDIMSEYYYKRENKFGIGFFVDFF